MLDKNAIDFANARPRDEVEREHPDATFVSGRMLLGLKGDEFADEEMKEYKGRFIAGGHNQKDAFGSRVVEKVLERTGGQDVQRRQGG